jgi:DNA-binding NarL/FixJ family response regulator
VLLDILMPQMNGIRATQGLNGRHGVKVVFLSVQQDQEFVAAAFESGATALRLQIADAFRPSVGH